MTFEELNDTLTITLDNHVDSDNAHGVEEEIFAKLTDAAKIVRIDASGLEYISSAGLRVLLKLEKRQSCQVEIFNVSRDVYDILEMTGFTDLLKVKRAHREVSVEGCEVIGAGGYGTVYRLDEETIVKVYRSFVSEAFIDGEREASKTAFVLGIPTAIPYDIVKVGDQYGVVYEMVDAKTVAQLIDRDHSRLPELGALSARALRDFHQITPSAGDFPRHKDKYEDVIEQISGYLTPDEKKRMTDFLDSIPERNTFLHGDYNPKNVMLRDGEVILIDIGAGSVGHPVFDLAGLMLAYLHLPKSISGPKVARQLLGFDLELAADMWKIMISTYFETEDPAELEKINAMVLPVMALNIVFQSFTREPLTEEETIRKVNTHVRHGFFGALDKAQPIDF